MFTIKTFVDEPLTSTFDSHSPAQPCHHRHHLGSGSCNCDPRLPRSGEGHASQDPRLPDPPTSASESPLPSPPLPSQRPIVPRHQNCHPLPLPPPPKSGKGGASQSLLRSGEGSVSLDTRLPEIVHCVIFTIVSEHVHHV
uniref:Uncharacterized protein n=1 Tax=Kalanchoe fedtschenkoi TaxID=63787 RepID=A0A7N0TDY3_KALFE